MPQGHTPEQDKRQQKLRPLIFKTMDLQGDYETAKAFIRYEALKTLLKNSGHSGNLDDETDAYIIENMK